MEPTLFCHSGKLQKYTAHTIIKTRDPTLMQGSQQKGTRVNYDGTDSKATHGVSTTWMDKEQVTNEWSKLYRPAWQVDSTIQVHKTSWRMQSCECQSSSTAKQANNLYSLAGLKCVRPNSLLGKGMKRCIPKATKCHSWTRVDGGLCPPPILEWPGNPIVAPFILG